MDKAASFYLADWGFESLPGRPPPDHIPAARADDAGGRRQGTAMNDVDLLHLERAVELAEAALASGDEPFGSVLVGADGTRLFEDHNHVAGGDQTRHPEFAIARWAAEQLAPADRAAATVYTSGEHCPMCAAAHGWVGLGRIVYATSSEQLSGWLAELGGAPGPVAALPIRTVVPAAVVDGPAPELAGRVRALQVAFRTGSRG
jgi:tRNA(Arg) A34 adenosine deaminase TadA